MYIKKLYVTNTNIVEKKERDERFFVCFDF